MTSHKIQLQFSAPYIAISILTAFLVLGCTFTIAHAGGSGSSDSGSSNSGSSNSSSNSSNNYYDSVNNAVDRGNDPSNMTDFSSGNQNTTFGENCATCNSTTQSFSNGDGTYNTITTYTNEGGNSGGGLAGTSGGGNGCSGSNCGGTPSSGGNTGGSGGNPQSCTSAGKGSAPVCSPKPVTSVPVSNCTSGGKGSAPVCKASSCRLSTGQTIADGQSVTLFSSPSGQCSPVVHTCTNGVLSNGSGYLSCSGAAAPAGAVSDITIHALPSIVRYGGSSMISWDGGSVDSCTVTGPSFSASGVTGSKLATSIPEERTYTLTCVWTGANGSPASSKTANVTVRIVPLWREF